MFKRDLQKVRERRMGFFIWINVRYPDGRILNNQRLERGATAPGELPGK